MAVRTVQAAVPTIAKQAAFLSVMSGLWSRAGVIRNQTLVGTAKPGVEYDQRWLSPMVFLLILRM